MSRRVSLPDFLGKEDSNINSIFSDDSDEESTRTISVKKILMRVIKEELTERQRQVIILYYFKNMNIVSIADMLGISPASVSITMKRARNTILRYLKYYF